MVIHLNYGLLLAYVALPVFLLGELVFRCPSCTAEDLASCPKVSGVCAEIVREPGCGCCPVCARQEGELCGVYSPRCSSGLRCYPSVDNDFPLQQLIQGMGRCGQKVDLDIVVPETTNEVHGTAKPLTKRPINPWFRDVAIKTHQNEQRTKLRVNQPEEPQVPKIPQSTEVQEYKTICEQELDKVLEEISKMTSEDNRGPLENLYELKFPNCDKSGQYNLKQCNMSTHGQRGECWCVNPLTGVQIPATPKVRGDPNCNQFQEGVRVMPTAAASQ